MILTGGREKRRVVRPPQSTSIADAEPGLGHNGGPPLGGWRGYCWRRAHAEAWKAPPREIVLRRMRRAKQLGMTYREYTLEILERGRYL
jgi:hypothetical protein